jgi:hypothetical protein
VLPEVSSNSTSHASGTGHRNGAPESIVTMAQIRVELERRNELKKARDRRYRARKRERELTLARERAAAWWAEHSMATEADSNGHGPFIHTVAPRRADEAEPAEQLCVFVVDREGVVELVCRSLP